MSTEGYDIIGDVHGQAKKLVGLLHKLGYQAREGIWSDPRRTAIFVGDLIDRGPFELETIDIVRPMVESGAAHCILGNHEFNAIAWATPDPDEPSEYLRRHDRPSNREQHQAFLAEVENTPRHHELITWFKTLPLWLDFGRFRVVHACWNDDYISRLKPHIGPENTLTDKLIVSANRKGLWAYEAIETLCKGLETNLPDGKFFHDQDGHVRHAARIKWWATDPLSFRNSVLAPRTVLAEMPDGPLPHDPRLAPYRGPPVFFGHYWSIGVPEVFAGKFACVDYSAGRDGPLVAYRWDGEAELRNAHFIWYEGD